MRTKRSGTSLATRAMEHLQRAEVRESRKGAHWDSHTYRVAAVIIGWRFFDHLETAVERALREFPLPCPSPYQPQYIEPVSPPVVQPLWIVDGRNGWDWKQSVLAYLDYRSGSAWRSVLQTKQDYDYQIYARAKYEVNNAWSQPDPPTEYEKVCPKKPPQSVKDAAAASRIA